MPYARNGLLIAGVLAGVVYVAATAWPWAVLFYSALAGYVLLDKASWRVRGPLLIGLVLVAAATLPIGKPAEDFGWMSYGPSGELDMMLRRMAEQSLTSIAWIGFVILVGHACLCAAVWALPSRRNVVLAVVIVLAVVAGLIAVGSTAAAILTLSDVHTRPAVWIAGLGLLASLAIAVVASQRAGMAWLTVAAVALLAWHSLDLLELAATNAALANGPADGIPILGLATIVQAPDFGQALLLAASPSGLLLVVLGCCLRAHASPHPPAS